jgi:hypothetical protein
MKTFGGIGSNQTRDQISGLPFLLPFVFSAAARRLQVACEGPRYLDPVTRSVDAGPGLGVEEMQP